jgi:molybdopterin molybdotransferase
MVTKPVQAIVSFEQARHIVEQHAAQVASGPAEAVELLAAAGRVLAEEIRADRDLPPFPRATRDGFAVRAADVAGVPAVLQIIGEIRAGASASESALQVGSQQAVEIMTGAPVPAGADAVVMVEYTQRDGDRVEVQRSVASGENVVPRGSESKAGELLLSSGTRLTPSAIGLAASVGNATVSVYKRPRVAILSTGDEVIDVACSPGPNQIRNSNTYSLSTQVQSAGGMPLMLPIAPDRAEPLRELIEQGLEADLLLLTGGVSMGKYDLVEQVLQQLNAEFFFTGAQIQPGKPIVFGRASASPTEKVTYLFGLPGNPVSTMVCFELFARPMIEALSGASPNPLRFLQARLKSDVKTKTGLTRFLPAQLSGEFAGTEVELVRWQGSGDMVSTARANCYLVIPPDREKFAAGEMVSVLITNS